MAKQAWVWGVLAISALLASGAAAGSTRLALARLQVADLQLHELVVTVDYATPTTPPALRLRIGRVTAAGLAIERLDWRCAWQLVPQRRCAGTLRVGGRPHGALVLRADDTLQLRWDDGARALEGSYADDRGALHARLTALPLAWLQPLLAGSLADMSITGGTLGGEVRRAAAGQPLEVRVGIDDAGLDSSAGDIAAAGVDAALQFAIAADAATATTVTATIAQGEVLLGPLYSALAAESRLEFAFASTAGLGALAGPLRWIDPEGFAASLALEPDDRWNLVLSADDLTRSGPRYLSSLLASAGLPDAELAGAMDLELGGSGTSLHALSLQLRTLALAQAGKGLRLAGVEGSLNWRATGTAADSDLAWQQLAVYGVDMGPSRLALRSDQGKLHLRAPLVLAPLQGQLSIKDGWIDPLQRAAELSAEVGGLSLAALSARAGWPPFAGTIAGQLPRARYGNQRLQVDGVLGIDVFGGRVELGSLALERPLGVAPTLAADVRLDDLDLAPLTAAFGFGEISGRLDGRIAGLRLVDWSPVAFDADLHTDPDYRGPRRISQRAVQDIGRVGGGLAGGVQNQLLSVFDSFGYRRIGLRCRLENNVCQMGGVEDGGTGYVLIEGAGLPRVTVNGFQRRVDWPVLLARLQAATQGGIKFD